jgi:hypothetical protein
VELSFHACLLNNLLILKIPQKKIVLNFLKISTFCTNNKNLCQSCCQGTMIVATNDIFALIYHAAEESLIILV